MLIAISIRVLISTAIARIITDVTPSCCYYCYD